MRRVCVYIAGPFSRGEPGANVHNAIWIGERLHRRGYIPFIPHMTLFWETVCGGKTYEEWMAYDQVWLLKCDALYRMPGDSPGADREVAFAHAHGIPVVHNIDQLTEIFPLN